MKLNAPILWPRFYLAVFAAILSFFLMVEPMPVKAGVPLHGLPSNECDLSSSGGATSPCPSGVNNAVGQSSPNPAIIASRSITNTHATTAIDAFGYCRYVYNGSGSSIFVPFNSFGEWVGQSGTTYGFLKNLPSGVTALDCSRGGAVAIPPNFGASPQTNQCNGLPVPASKSITAPYMPYPPATTYTAPSVQFINCISPDGTSFTETAVAILTGIDSGSGPSSTIGWNVTSVAYSYNAQCGVADIQNGGKSTTTSPGSGLCHIGPATTPVLDALQANWVWTCQAGNGGGTPASCSTPNIISANGVCGSSNGQSFTSLTSASSNLCSVGPVSSFSGSGPWAWNCDATGSGTSASCSASLKATSCSSISVTWTVGTATCTGTAAPASNNTSTSVTATSTATGTASFKCSNGTYSPTPDAIPTPVCTNPPGCNQWSDAPIPLYYDASGDPSGFWSSVWATGICTGGRFSSTGNATQCIDSSECDIGVCAAFGYVCLN